MASLFAGAVVNRIAFAGGSFLFYMLGNSKCSLIEQERHNEAIEELQKAKEKWYGNEVAKKDRIQKLRLQLSDANNDINKTNNDFDELRSVQSIQFNGSQGMMQFTQEPKLEDFNKPSDEMKD